jgi:hypothetical protein
LKLETAESSSFGFHRTNFLLEVGGTGLVWRWPSRRAFMQSRETVVFRSTFLTQVAFPTSIGGPRQNQKSMREYRLGR